MGGELEYFVFPSLYYLLSFFFIFYIINNVLVSCSLILSLFYAVFFSFLSLPAHDENGMTFAF